MNKSKQNPIIIILQLIIIAITIILIDTKYITIELITNYYQQ